MQKSHRVLLCVVLFCAFSQLDALPLQILVTGDMHGWLQSQLIDKLAAVTAAFNFGN